LVYYDASVVYNVNIFISSRIDVAIVKLCLLTAIWVSLVLPAAACTTEPAPASSPATSSSEESAVPEEAVASEPTTAPQSAPAADAEPASSRDDGNGIEEPVLSNNLKRNCQFAQVSEDFDDTGLPIGETAVNFTLKDAHDTEFRLSRLLAEKPVVMVLGSFT